MVRLLVVIGLFAGALHAQAGAAPALQERSGAPVVGAKTKVQVDADQLLALAEALKAKLDSTKKDELSMQVIHDAEQIEKLARALMDRPK